MPTAWKLLKLLERTLFKKLEVGTNHVVGSPFKCGLPHTMSHDIGTKQNKNMAWAAVRVWAAATSVVLGTAWKTPRIKDIIVV